MCVCVWVCCVCVWELASFCSVIAFFPPLSRFVAEIFPACVHKNNLCLAHFHMLLRNQIIGAPVWESMRQKRERERVGVYMCVCVWVYYENATNYSRIKVIINFPQTLFWQSFWNLCAHSCRLNPPPAHLRPSHTHTHHSWRSFQLEILIFFALLSTAAFAFTSSSKLWPILKEAAMWQG